MEWQPIETAPTDATIDLWAFDGRIPDCRWRVPEHPPIGWERDKETWCYFHGEWGEYVEIGGEPTHWMSVTAPETSPSETTSSAQPAPEAR